MPDSLNGPAFQGFLQVVTVVLLASRTGFENLVPKTITLAQQQHSFGFQLPGVDMRLAGPGV